MLRYSVLTPLDPGYSYASFLLFRSLLLTLLLSFLFSYFLTLLLYPLTLIHSSSYSLLSLLLFHSPTFPLALLFSLFLTLLSCPPSYSPAIILMFSFIHPLILLLPSYSSLISSHSLLSLLHAMRFADAPGELRVAVRLELYLAGVLGTATAVASVSCPNSCPHNVWARPATTHTPVSCPQRPTHTQQHI